MWRLITGISGQDASYLSEYLIHKGHKFFGAVLTNVEWGGETNVTELPVLTINFTYSKMEYPK